MPRVRNHYLQPAHQPKHNTKHRSTPLQIRAHLAAETQQSAPNGHQRERPQILPHSLRLKHKHRLAPRPRTAPHSTALRAQGRKRRESKRRRTAISSLICSRTRTIATSAGGLNVLLLKYVVGTILFWLLLKVFTAMDAWLYELQNQMISSPTKPLAIF